MVVVIIIIIVMFRGIWLLREQAERHKGGNFETATFSWRFHKRLWSIQMKHADEASEKEDRRRGGRGTGGKGEGGRGANGRKKNAELFGKASFLLRRRRIDSCRLSEAVRVKEKWGRSFFSEGGRGDGGAEAVPKATVSPRRAVVVVVVVVIEAAASRKAIRKISYDSHRTIFRLSAI